MLNKMFITRLENLSNEVLYEIFEYLDGCFLYDTFSNLNTRFVYLLNYSSLPLKINLSWTSKSVFEHYCKHIIVPNQTRIISLHIPNPLAINAFLSSFSINTAFIRLESLNFGKMNSDHIIPLLTLLKSLPRLFSLSIDVTNPQDNISDIYQLIVMLPVLKYCKISSERGEPIFTKSVLTRREEQQESTIEHLIINGVGRFDQLGAILSYTPRLTHLCCHSLNIVDDQIRQTIVMTNLKKLSIDLGSIPFNLFESFICKVSSRLEVLRISTRHEKAYLDAHQWQQLISYQIPHLRIFDFQFKSGLFYDQIQSADYDKLIEQFNSEFWIERRWFFASHDCRGTYGTFKIVYSISPYRRQYYKLYEHTTDNFEISPYQNESTHLCRHVLIDKQWTNIGCSIRFPFATKLTLAGGYAADIPFLISNLSSIMSLAQVTTLVLEYDYLFMKKLLMLLQYMPNIGSLAIPQTAIIQPRDLSEHEMNTVRLLSKKNRVTKVTITDRECTLKQLQFLLNLCPQIEYITIKLTESYETSIIQFLITKMKENNYRFFLLCLTRWYTNNDMVKKIHAIIDAEKLLDNYSLDLFKGNVYLWC